LTDIRLACRISPLRGIESGVIGKDMSPSASSYPELDLHRFTTDEAIMKLEQFLYEAYCTGVPIVRIVHGKGTGALRSKIRGWLPKQSLVKSFRSGLSWEGGDGVTIVEMGD